MTDTNFFVVVGRLTRDCELTYTQSGCAIGKFAVACNSSKKSGDTYVEEANFFNITMFGKYIEAVTPYLKKGQQVVVTGHLKQDRWEKDGKKYSAVAMQGDTLQLAGRSGGGNSSSANSSYSSASSAPSQTKNQGAAEPPQDFAAGGDNFPEDVPF